MSTSNNTAVGDLPDSIWIKLVIPVMRTCKHGESNTSVLEDLMLHARNPVKEILPKLNLPDHRAKAPK
ncbi:hypothetical protein Tco_1167658 [Tanacetum coccineum]